MIDMSSFKKPVHRSLLPRELVAGVPQVGLFIIFISGLFFIYAIQFYFMIVPIVILYCVMRFLTSKDQWYIEIVLSNISQKDIYIP